MVKEQLEYMNGFDDEWSYVSVRFSCAFFSLYFGKPCLIVICAIRTFMCSACWLSRGKSCYVLCERMLKNPFEEPGVIRAHSPFVPSCLTSSCFRPNFLLCGLFLAQLVGCLL